MKNFLNLTMIVLSIMSVYIMDNGVVTKKRKYTVELQHLCPSVPSETAEKCTRSFNITKYFQKIYTEDEAKKLNGNPNRLPNQWKDLLECQMDNLETPSISLEVHCYFEGVKEGLVAFNRDFAKTEEGINQMFTELNSQIENAKNRHVREMLEEVKLELQQSLNTIDKQELNVKADAEPNASR